MFAKLLDQGNLVTALRALDLIGVDHILWGSDEPLLGADPKDMEKLDVTPAEREMIMSGNAKRMLGLT